MSAELVMIGTGKIDSWVKKCLAYIGIMGDVPSENIICPLSGLKVNLDASGTCNRASCINHKEYKPESH